MKYAILRLHEVLKARGRGKTSHYDHHGTYRFPSLTQVPGAPRTVQTHALADPTAGLELTQSGPPSTTGQTPGQTLPQSRILRSFL